MKALTMNDVDMKGKRVVMRVDVNVPIHDGVITSDKRIRAVLPTIKKALDAARASFCLRIWAAPPRACLKNSSLCVPWPLTWASCSACPWNSAPNR